MSKIEDKVSVTPKILLQGGEVKFTEENGFQEYNTEYGWLAIPVIDVPLDDLLMTYEDLVMELSYKEVELAKIKEEHMVKEFEILTTFDFKKIYGKDNEKIRKAHVHNELFDLDTRRSDLELSVEWIKNYIPLLRECIRVKHDSIPHINSPKPIVLGGSHIDKDKLEKQIKKALDDIKS